MPDKAPTSRVPVDVPPSDSKIVSSLPALFKTISNAPVWSQLAVKAPRATASDAICMPFPVLTVTVTLPPLSAVVTPFPPAIVLVPPKLVAEDPLSPAKVIEELSNSVLSICPDGKVTVPDDTLSPVMLLKAPVLDSLSVPPV